MTDTFTAPDRVLDSIFSLTAIGIIDAEDGFHPCVLEYSRMKETERQFLYRWFWINPLTQEPEPFSHGFKDCHSAYAYAHEIGMPLIHPSQFNALTESVRSAYTDSPLTRIKP